jgi:SAM-dependent methyltransferase
MSQIAGQMQGRAGSSKRRARYGIDAPPVVLMLIVVGSLLALVAASGLGWPWPIPVPASVSIAAVPFAVLFLLYAAEMLSSSLVRKKRVRDRLVAALELKGSERVLDAGCGRGLALIGCAKKLTTGKAIGIDLWTRDVSGNTPDATRANAAAEGVADKVEVETGDVTQLPFADAAFDAIISMTVIHNIPSRDARDRAVGEFLRVLKPGGRIALFDLLHTARYAELMQQAGLTVRVLSTDRLWGFRCRSLLAEKPGHRTS